MEIIHDALIDWLAHGALAAAWWQVLLYTLVTTHITIAAVTIFLHRAQAHQALTLTALPSHFFRLWLWLKTGMNTKGWVATHRKHHAKCETEADPHSPQTRGIRTVLLQGTELYRVEATNPETLRRYGHKTPDDWIERNLYSRYSWQGVGLTLILDLFLFGAIGLTVWAVQMLWIPVTAAGIINGVGHWWGYRNFDAPDASTNISPWGIIIGGEELHNNHHTYPASAKLSVQRHEFDIGWLYIVILAQLGFARVRIEGLPPEVEFVETERWDDATVEAIIRFRYQALRWFDETKRKYGHEKVDWEGMRQRLARLWTEPKPEAGSVRQFRTRTELLIELNRWREAVLASGSAGLRSLASRLARLKDARS